MEVIKNNKDEVQLLSKNAQTLSDYIINNFDMNIFEIKRKYTHTFRVASLCLNVAKSLNFDEALAYNIGLLHDYARFSQWYKYNTFIDIESVDHAVEAVKILFDDGDIEKFDIDKDDYNMIYLTIKFHNKAVIDFDYIKQYMKEHNEQKYCYDEIIGYCKLVRDCDKMDIFHRLGNGDMKLYIDGDGYSQVVMDCVKNRHFVYTKDVQTKLDRLFAFIALLFDLNYPESIEQINIKNYFKALDFYYGNLLKEEDRKVLLKTFEDVEDYFNKKMENTKENGNNQKL